MHEHAPLIDSLGGGTAIAEWLAERTGASFDRERVYKWKRIGIPWRHRALVSVMAAERHVALPENFLGIAA